MDKNWTVVVTGSSGHVGGRLAAELVRRGHTVRPLTRNDGDVADRTAMRQALDGVHARRRRLRGGGANRRARVRGGGARAGRRADRLPRRHRPRRRAVTALRSRREVGEILRSSGVPTIEFRASVVVGDGSASFDLVKTLVERLPTVVAPDWLDKLAQPIAIDDVVGYLIAALDVPIEDEAVYEIGGADQVRYRDLVDEVAEQLGRPKIALTVPVPPLLVAPTFELRLLESLRYDTDVRDDSARRDFDVEPVGLQEAVAAALA